MTPDHSTTDDMVAESALQLWSAAQTDFDPFEVDSSEWLTDPEVQKVETTTAGSSRQAQFTVYLKQVSTDGDMEDAE